MHWRAVLLVYLSIDAVRSHGTFCTLRELITSLTSETTCDKVGSFTLPWLDGSTEEQTVGPDDFGFGVLRNLTGIQKDSPDFGHSLSISAGGEDGINEKQWDLVAKGLRRHRQNLQSKILEG